MPNNTWTRLSDAPVPGDGATMAYDSQRDFFLAVACNDTRVYDPRADVWTNLNASPGRVFAGSGCAANGDSFEAVIYHPDQDAFVFQGNATAMFRFNP
jgi:hypothetical protein